MRDLSSFFHQSFKNDNFQKRDTRRKEIYNGKDKSFNLKLIKASRKKRKKLNIKNIMKLYEKEKNIIKRKKTQQREEK